MSFNVRNIFHVKTSIGDSWILPPTKYLNRLVRQRQFSTVHGDD